MCDNQQAVDLFFFLFLADVIKTNSYILAPKKTLWQLDLKSWSPIGH